MWRFWISPRSLAIWAALLVLACLAFPVVRSDTGWASALRFFIPVFVTGILPGFIAFIWARPASNVSLFDLVAVSAGLSLAMAQLLVFMALGFGIQGTNWGHVLPLSILGAAGALVYFRAGSPPLQVTVRTADIVLLVGLAALVAVLYVGGNHWFMSWVNEDLMHLSIVRRLLEASSPSPDTIHFVKGITYTYPFPGIHYFYALTSAVAGLDPVFIYDKMGAYWCLVALTTLYAFALTVFRSRRVATVTLALALGLVLLGPLARVPGYYWGQLSPMPHVSDVAMNVVLPLQLLFAVRAIAAPQEAATRFYMAAVMLMTVMISVVHVREFIQYAAYMGLAVAFLVVTRHPRWRRGLATLVVSIMIFAGFYLWHRANVWNVTSLVSQGQEAFVAFVASLTVADLLSPLRPYASGIRETMFYGLGGLMLATAPVTAVAFRRRPFVWMMMLSIFVYLAVIRIGALSVPYVYLTFDEILSSTMRNVAFFGYVMLGGGAYWLGWRINRLVAQDPDWARALTAVCAGLSVGVLAWLCERVGASADAFADFGLAVLLAVSGFALAAMYVLDAKAPVPPVFRWVRMIVNGDGITAPSTTPRRGSVVVALGLAAPLAMFAAKPDQSPIRQALQEPSPAAAEDAIGGYYPRFARAVFGTLADGVDDRSVCRREKAAVPSDGIFRVPPDGDGSVLWCTPPARLVRWLLDNIGPEAVMMINPANAYPAIPFFRGRLVVPAPIYTLRGWETVLPDVARVIRDARARHGAMPVFNAADGVDLKFSTLKGLGASVLLVDPMYHGPVMKVVATRPDLFKVVFEESEWAVVALSDTDTS